MKKDKYLQIFNYLKEFSKLRSNPVRDIDAQENQYPEKYWFNDIPLNDNFENIIRSDFNEENDYWLKVKKPKEPAKPEFAKLPEKLEKWIDKPTLFNEKDEPKLKESLVVEGETFSIEDFPGIHTELQLYIDKKWIDDIIEYNEKLEAYQVEHFEYEKLNTVYKHLFRIFNKSQQFGEEYELVVGVGLLNFKENDESPKIFRHIITQRADINFEYSQKDSQILVSPNLDSAPQIETDSILDLVEQFDTQNLIEAEKSAQELFAGKEIDTIFNRKIHEALGSFSQRFCPEKDGDYFEIVDRPSISDQKPKVYFSPCLILRKRNTRSFTALYEKILENIENSEEDLEIPTINDLIGIHANNDTENAAQEKAYSNSQNEPIFFPKEYNDEQIEIVEKAKRNNKVLVQGPPGTGKSHTIANLICHLLANGKKILITAYTKRALEVLKDKLPPEFRNLTVNLLSGDSTSIQDLQSSVNAINDELSRANLSQYQSQIDSFENELKKTRESISETSNELVKIKEKGTRKQDINEKYHGTLTEIAEELEKDEIKYAWYKDSFKNLKNLEILDDIKNLIPKIRNYQNIDPIEFEYEMPETDRLISVERLISYKEKLSNLLEKYPNKSGQRSINYQDYNTLKDLLTQLLDTLNKIDLINISFKEEVFDSFFSNQQAMWTQKIQQADKIFKKIRECDLEQIDRDLEIKYPQDKSIKQLKYDAQILLKYLKGGKDLSGYLFQLKKAFLTKEIKERLYFTENVLVNGSPCDTIQEFEIVITNLELKQDFEGLAEIWGHALESNRFINHRNYYTEIRENVTRLLNLLNIASELKSKVSEIPSLNIRRFNAEEIKVLLFEVEYNKLLSEVESIKEEIHKSKVSLSGINVHPVKHKILESLESIDTQLYLESLQELREIKNRFLDFKEFKALESKIKISFPSLHESIIQGGFEEHDILELKHAIFFLNAKHELGRITNVNYENKLVHSLSELERKERKQIAELASKKAWSEVVKGLDENPNIQSHLIAWKQAVRSIPQSRRSPNYKHFRNVAQREMEYCKKSIPCWIMPLYQVVEQFQPEPEIFDYIIIDEASQLGPEAIFLFYLAKKVIVVGDDKQTAPEYVGVSDNLVNSLIHKYLKPDLGNEIPFADFYGLKHSFFDHCDRLTGGKRIVLQEHFRCMPEIIEFSNRHFYAPDGKGLYPLKQYSENRLEPLVTLFCSNGYTEGIGARIINEPEAAHIAESIGKLIEDERYFGKTIGVITLQGNQQASLIENLLLKQIGEKEFHKRKIVCGNSSSFQGDERDIIFLSLVTAKDHRRSALVRPEDERRFNVAVSRAKEQIWLFHSVQLDDLSNKNDLRYKLLDHFKNFNSYQPIYNTLIERRLGTQPEPFDSWFEVDVYNDIIRRDLKIIPQYEVAKGRYRIDMVALLPDGTKIAIECDGDKWHGPEQHQNDIMRQKVLERCGWQFFRVRGYEYYTNREKALEPFMNMIPVFEEKKIELKTDYVLHESNILQEKEVSTNDSLEVQSSGLVNNPYDEENSLEQFEQIDLKPRTDKILRYFNLFNSGTYILTDKEPLEADYVIPIQEIHKSGFLLQCYNSGHINKVHIPVLLSKRIGKEYMNGLNRDGELMHIQIVESERIIGIYFNENGKRKFKAHLSENISTREQLHLQGYKVIYNDFDQIEYNIMPLEIYNDISRLVFQSFTANGKPVDNKYYEYEWSVIKRHSRKKQAQNEGKGNFIQNSLFDSIVGLNCIVKIKFISNDKELKVKLVDYPTNGSEIIDGVQIVNIRKPIAIAIKGKTIGDKVKIGDSDIVVEIIEIR